MKNIATLLFSVIAIVSVPVFLYGDDDQQLLKSEKRQVNCFEVPIVSDVLFLIDASPTMDSEFGDNTRLSATVEEVSNAIWNLPENLRFNVAFFDDGLHWVDGFYRLLPADNTNKSHIIQSMYKVEVGFGANYEIALGFPMVYSPRPKQVILITDGRPGDLRHLDEAKALQEAKIQLDVVGLDLSALSLRMMREISKPTGGSVAVAKEPRAAADLAQLSDEDRDAEFEFDE
ncbi:MAG: vWA domain-containing protein [Verrucomicrobiota bacterium]